MAKWIKTQPPDPTEEEIAAACLAFQATWSPEERAKRRRGMVRHRDEATEDWTAPVYSESALGLQPGWDG